MTNHLIISFVFTFFFGTIRLISLTQLMKQPIPGLLSLFVGSKTVSTYFILGLFDMLIFIMSCGWQIYFWANYFHLFTNK